jgi:hypothetical protein
MANQVVDLFLSEQVPPSRVEPDLESVRTNLREFLSDTEDPIVGISDAALDLYGRLFEKSPHRHSMTFRAFVWVMEAREGLSDVRIDASQNAGRTAVRNWILDSVAGLFPSASAT